MNSAGIDDLIDQSKPKSLYQRLVDSIIEQLDPDYVAESPYSVAPELLRYQNDPVGFGQDILGESYTDDIKEVMLSVRDNPVTIARSGNGTGKSHGAARVAVWWYKCFPNAQVITAAAPPLNNLQDILWGEIGGITVDHPELFEGDKINMLEIRRRSKEFIKGVAIPKQGTPAERKAAFSGKHAPHLLFIIDEGDGVPPEIYEAIESCMSGGHVRMLIMFNPRSETGPVYLKERDHQAHVVKLTAFNHPNVVTGEDVYPGAVSREMTVRRINEWTRPLAATEVKNEECFQVPDFLVGCVAYSQDGRRAYPPLKEGWRKVTFAPFSYMVLAEYPLMGENQMISREWIEAARARWDAYVAKNGETPPAGIRPKCGMDVAELGTDESVFYPRWGDYLGTCTTWGGVDTDESAQNCKALYQKYNAECIYIDSTGVGAGVWGPLHKLAAINAERVMVASSPTVDLEIGEFSMLRDQLMWATREWVKRETSMLPPDEMLIEELRLLRYTVGNNGKIKVTDKSEFRSVLRRSCDRLDALALTFAPTQFTRSKKLVTW